MKNKLKVQRAIHDLTQEDLAKHIQVSRQSINAIEKNKYVPSTLLALKMAKLFSVPVEELFVLEEEDLKDINPLPIDEWTSRLV